MKKIFYIIVAAAMVCGCAENEEGEGGEATGGIYGVITDKATGEPVQSASIKLSPTGATHVTGSEGQYEFPGLKAGDYAINVTKTGYADLVNCKITVAAGKTNKGDVQLEKLPPSLRVVNDKGQPIDSLEFGAVYPSRAFTILNDGPEKLEWQISETVKWVTVNLRSGTLLSNGTQSVELAIDREKLKGGYEAALLNITTNNGHKELKITAIGNELPVVTTIENVSDITFTSATIYGKVANPGIPPYRECGFVYAKQRNVSIENTIERKQGLDNGGFSTPVTGLTPSTTYYYNTYIMSSNGDTIYGFERTFKTRTPVLPEIATYTARKIHESGALLSGYIISSGAPAYAEKGFLCATFINPTVEHFEKKITFGGSGGAGYFSAAVSNLSAATYYYRTYAITPYDTVYGGQGHFIPAAPYVASGNTGVAKDDENDYDYSSSSGDASRFTHAEANQICQNLVIGAYDDWRLPTIEELENMYDNRNSIGNFVTSSSSGSVDTRYWSNTQNGDAVENTAWQTGYMSLEFATKKRVYGNPYAAGYNRARCVRTLQ
jgi:hypothetical protein